MRFHYCEWMTKKKVSLVRWLWTHVWSRVAAHGHSRFFLAHRGLVLLTVSYRGGEEYGRRQPN